MVSDGEKENGEGEEDSNCPEITVIREEKIRLRKTWRHNVIIKVLERSIGYAYLFNRIATLWHLKARLELVTLTNDYFLVKFGLKDDYDYAKFGGPWMVMDHYLIVKEWIPNFDPMKDKTEKKIIVWVQFLNLPMKCYDL